MQTHVGRPKDLKKRQCILDAAKQLFLEHGYHASSMNQIAALAGVSKITVYSHFSDKASLFTDAIEHTCELFLQQMNVLELHAECNFLALLEQACHMVLNMVNLPQAIKLELLLLELAAEKNPLLLPFYNASHQKLRLFWAAFFQQAIHYQFMQCTDLKVAIELIVSLLMGARHHEVLLGLEAPPTPEQQQEIIQRSIVIFKRVYCPQFV